jgi:hypothetical protein
MNELETPVLIAGGEVGVADRVYALGTPPELAEVLAQ